MLQLETVLAVVIALITVNLLIVGYYIVSVLRDVKRTVRKAESVIDDIDASVKDGLEKAKALHAPLQALAATTVAITGVVKGSELVRKATQSIATASDQINAANGTNGSSQSKKQPKAPKVRRPRFFRKK